MTGELPTVYAPDDRPVDRRDAPHAARAPELDSDDDFRAGWPPTVYSPLAGRPERSLARRVAVRVVAYPDFPRQGIVFRDITPVLLDPELTADVVSAMAREAGNRRADVIVGIESRGFLFGAPVATALGLPLVVVRKQGKLPGDTVARKYDLEYGEAELELQVDSVGDGQAAFVVDDLLATGGTLAAAVRLLEGAGAGVAGLGVLVELQALRGREKFEKYNLMSILTL